jgi:hypothetical protein
VFDREGDCLVRESKRRLKFERDSYFDRTFTSQLLRLLQVKLVVDNS